MKKLFYACCILLTPVISITSCEEENNQPSGGPDVVLVTDGYLCTTGPSDFAAMDTLYYHFYAGGEELRIYRTEFADSKQQVHLTTTSENNMRVEMKTPYVDGLGRQLKYLGINKAVNPSVTGFPNHPYQFKLYDNPDPETQFVIAREPGDLNKFTIESNLYKGQYLTTGKWKGDKGEDHPNLVFETGKKYWFFK